MPALRSRDNTQQSLEVGTGRPSLPTLTIIAPTPKTFTFPASHSLDISPYSTPSNSPFEPDLNFLELASPASSCLPTPPPLSRALSPDSSVSVVSSPSSHNNRKSESLDAERRPKRGDEDYIKRPENAFILFRRSTSKRQQEEDGAVSGVAARKQRQADLSKTISQKWKSLSTKDRQYWEELAKEKKKEHQEMYPDYVYRPQRVRDKDGKARNKKYTKRSRGKNAQHDVETDVETAYVVPPRPIGRSTSAPTPSPMSYHTIHIPTIFTKPSCPSSPSLIPMISRRAAYSGAVESVMSNFDYSAASTHQAGHEAGLQSSELMRDLFDLPTQSSEPPLPSSAAPTAGPYTPSSVLIDPTFAQLSAFSPTQTCDPDQLIPSDLDVQMGTQTLMGSTYPWNPNAIWQTEPSMLMGNDFNLNDIPPIELSQGIFNYGDNAVFGISPQATLNGFPTEDFPHEFDQQFLHMDTAGAFHLESEFPTFSECA